MLNAIPYIFAINSIATLIVGASIYLVDKKKMENAIWFVYNILFTIWNFCIYKALDSQGAPITMYWFRASFVALIFLAPLFLHFLSVYSDKSVFRKQTLSKIYILFFLFFVASFIMPKEFIGGIREATYFKYTITPGVAFSIFTFIFIGFVFCGFYYLLRSSKLYVSFKRNQRMWLFFGMLLGMCAPINFFLATYRINIFPFGLFSVIPYLVLVGYAVSRHHVLEMDTVIGKTVVLAYFVLFVLFIHMIIVHLLHRIAGMEYFVSSIISGSVVLLNLLLTAHYVGVLKLNKVTDRIVYERKLNYYKFLENFSSISEKTADLDELANYVLDSLVNIVGVDSATLYLYNADNREFELIGYKGIEKRRLQTVRIIPITSSFIKFLKEGNIYVTTESEDFKEEYDLNKIKEAFETVNAKYAIALFYSVPLYYKRDLVGFLNLGKKKNASPYTKEDIDIFSAFGRQLSICIDKAKLYSRAIEDDLTKLYRINYFHKRIQEEIARANRYQRPFSLLLMDIDDFKKINDTFGHQTGNKVLKKLGHLIKMNIRKADIAARYGGEEFSILMPETTKSNAVIGAERLRRAIEEAFGESDKHFSLTVSIGVADYSPGMTRHELIKEADQALYKAKREGKNRVC